MNEIMMRIRDSSRIRDSDFCMDPGARYRSRIHLGFGFWIMIRDSMDLWTDYTIRIRDSSRIRDSGFCMDPGAKHRSQIHPGLGSGLWFGIRCGFMIRRPMIGLVAKIEADKNYWSSLLFSKPKPLTIFVWTATQAGLVIFWPTTSLFCYSFIGLQKFQTQGAASMIRFLLGAGFPTTPTIYQFEKFLPKGFLFSNSVDHIFFPRHEMIMRILWYTKRWLRFNGQYHN